MSKDDKKSRNYGDNQKYFKVPTEEIVNYAKNNSKIGFGLAIGVISFPFKFRPQKDYADFTSAFNFGAAIGASLPHRSWQKTTYSIITGYSLSSINLEPSNVRRNGEQLALTNNFSAFSFSVGLLIQHERAQVGIFGGIDQLSSTNQKQFGWQYQSKPWLSIGFGYAIFTTDGGAEPEESTLPPQKDE